MANLNQFYKGEAITIIAPKEGEMLKGEYDVDGNFMLDSEGYAGMRAYPDDLNLENGDPNKIVPFTTTPTGDYAGRAFTIDGGRSKDMVDGSYTVELVYGVGNDNRVIVKYKHAFTLVGSSYKRKDAQ